MRETILKDAVELIVPAQQSMMLVIRLTTAGVIARAGLTVDRINDVKLAVEEACSCMMSEAGGPERLRLHFSENDDALHIRICGDCECSGTPVGEDERTIVKCILESLVDEVELKMRASAIGSIRLTIKLAQ